MPTIIINDNNHEQGWITVSLNGDVTWLPVNKQVEVSSAILEVLDHADITYVSLASGDFTNIATNNAADGDYTLNGVPVTIGDIIDLESSYTTFNPVADIDAGGIKMHSDGSGGFNTNQIALQPALAADLIASGFTVLFEVSCTADILYGCVVFDDPNFTYQCGVQSTRVDGDSMSTKTTLSDKNYNDNHFDDEETPVGNSKLAVTFLSGGMSASLNGGAVFSIEADCLDPTMNTVSFAISGNVDGAPEDVRLRSFAFYEPVADADLPTLSAL